PKYKPTAGRYQRRHIVLVFRSGTWQNIPRKRKSYIPGFIGGKGEHDHDSREKRQVLYIYVRPRLCRIRPTHREMQTVQYEQQYSRRRSIGKRLDQCHPLRSERTNLVRSSQRGKLLRSSKEHFYERMGKPRTIRADRSFIAGRCGPKYMGWNIQWPSRD